MTRKLVNVLIIVSFVTLLVSFWNRNAIPRSIDFVAEISADPLQTKTRAASFSANWNDVDYQVKPQYDYELVGMIVSYRHHDDSSRMHRLAGDHLNMLDVCVVWGHNAMDIDLSKFDFWNGIFTCNVKTRDRAAWEAFDMAQLSNNHLISDNAAIRKRVRSISVGDQIRVRGRLASYESPGGERGTSTTRTDTGDGACETIFVDSFEILKPATSGWRWSMYVALAVLLSCLLVFFSRPFKSHLS